MADRPSKQSVAEVDIAAPDEIIETFDELNKAMVPTEEELKKMWERAVEDGPTPPHELIGWLFD